MGESGETAPPIQQGSELSVNLRNFIGGIETATKKRVTVKKEKAFYLERANKLLTLCLRHIFKFLYIRITFKNKKKVAWCRSVTVAISWRDVRT